MFDVCIPQRSFYTSKAIKILCFRGNKTFRICGKLTLDCSGLSETVVPLIVSNPGLQNGSTKYEGRIIVANALGLLMAYWAHPSRIQEQF